MFHCVGLCGTLFFNGYDGSLFNGLQSIDQWQEYFNHPDPVTLGLMNSAGFLPGFIASFCGDRLAHYFGRRWSVWIGSVIVIVGAIVMSLSTNVGIFCAGRAVMGFGTYLALAVAPSLLQEIAHPRFRAQISCFLANKTDTSIYYFAAIISAGTCMGCMSIVGDNSWRIPCWVQIVGPALTLIMTATMPESPRWLAKNDKADEAKRILIKYHANSTEDDPLVEYEFREICEALKDESVNNQTKYSDLVKGRGNIHRMAICLIVAVGTNWVGNGIVSYYLSPIMNSLGITSTITQLQTLLGLQFWNLIISTLAAIYVDRVGRRPLWLASTGGMLITFSVVMGLSAEYAKSSRKSVGAAAIPFLFLFYGSYDLAWTPLAYSYPVEIFPFSLRTKGQAIFIAVQTMAVSINTWVNPIALDALHWK
ncbi:general substrate transporter [Dactylonectria macrodidyma]|uniref:General substrate transporter n=1 Tax=Dactylonectria macrodidyma TaxID=307937 RepID=A0A9P9DYN8_9HYPO|nr:general substrate transporter [Dactylonectria macrodidyma]